MPIDLKMPSLSPTMESGTLARWVVGVGDRISPGDIIAEIETDKATMEFEAVDEGTVVSIIFDSGSQDVPVGTTIARISSDAEEIRDDSSFSQETKTANAIPQQQTSEAAEQPKMGPAARKRASELSIDPASIEGTGPKGSVTKQDIEAASKTPNHLVEEKFSNDKPTKATGPIARRLARHGGLDLETARTSRSAEENDKTTPVFSPSTISGISHRSEKLSNMRKTIARRLTQSKQEIPHIYLSADVNLEHLITIRRELNSELENSGFRISLNDFFIKALAKALTIVPRCNASFLGDSIVLYERVDVSVAVSVPNGLITPIVASAESKSISVISREIEELIERARDGRLQPHEFTGGTTTLSNLGMYGVDHFDAVINPPQAMILAVGSGSKRVMAIDEQPEIATVMTATGSFDHRAIDGADAAQFLNVFKELVESPMRLLT